MALFEPARHQTLTETPWNEAAARAAIERIGADTQGAYRGEAALWPIHPIDVSPERPDPMKTVYYGAAGVIWALQRLEAAGAVAKGRDYGAVLDGLPPRVQADAEALTGARSFAFLPGETGVLMMRFWRAPSPTLARQIKAAILAHRDDVSEGLLSGAPGVMLAALHMFDRTGDGAWADLYRDTAEAVWSRMRFNGQAQCWLWRQDLYGEQANQLGALHGFAGVASAFVRGLRHFAPARRTDVLERVRDTMAKTARREDGLVNWPFEGGGSAHPGSGSIRLQHCMGAPGFVNVLSGLPADPETDALLLGAGELVWAAGPLAKHPCLCHGTPGNGYALLKLFSRTGDEMWLQRARRFAMHAISQNAAFTAEHGQRKYSLWTGDLGLAMFLWSCVTADAAFPTLDVF